MVLDLFNGDPAKLPLPAGFQLARWIAVGSNGKDPHTPEAIDPVIVEGIKTLKSYGVNRIGAVAYCFGAKVSLFNRLPRATPSKGNLVS